MTAAEEWSDDDGPGEQLYATFILDGLEFAIDVNYVQDAIPYPELIVSLPASPPYIEGIIDLRDTIIPILNTKKRFAMAEQPQQSPGHIAITKCQGRYMGLTFDRINEVIRIPANQAVQLAPEFQREEELLSTIIKLEDGKRLIQVINPEALYNYAELPAQLRQQMSAGDQVHQAGQRQQIVVFRCASQVFGLDVQTVREIIIVPEQINQKILVEKYISGVISLRGEQISILDLRHYLSDQATAEDHDSRIIILQMAELTFGVLVNEIMEVLTFDLESLQAMPSWAGNQHAGGFQGVLETDHFSLVLLQADRLFSTALERVAEHQRLHDESVVHDGFHIDQHDEEARQQQAEEPVTYITFALDEVYGIEITSLREVVRFEDNIRPLPGQLPAIAGILNLRSEVIPVVNLRTLFGKPASGQTESLILIISCQGQQMGVLVDRLLEIRTVTNQAKNYVPQILSNERTRDAHGLVERVVDIEDRQGNHVSTMIINGSKFISELGGQQPLPLAASEATAAPEVTV